MAESVQSYRERRMQIRAQIQQKMGDLFRIENELSNVRTHRFGNFQVMTGDEIKANRQKEAELNSVRDVMDRELKQMWEEWRAPRNSKGIPNR